MGMVKIDGREVVYERNIKWVILLVHRLRSYSCFLWKKKVMNISGNSALTVTKRALSGSSMVRFTLISSILGKG